MEQPSSPTMRALITTELNKILATGVKDLGTMSFIRDAAPRLSHPQMRSVASFLGIAQGSAPTLAFLRTAILELTTSMLGESREVDMSEADDLEHPTPPPSQTNTIPLPDPRRGNPQASEATGLGAGPSRPESTYAPENSVPLGALPPGSQVTAGTILLQQNKILTALAAQVGHLSFALGQLATNNEVDLDILGEKAMDIEQIHISLKSIAPVMQRLIKEEGNRQSSHTFNPRPRSPSPNRGGEARSAARAAAYKKKQDLRDDSHSIRLQPVNSQGVRMISPRLMASTLQAWIRGHSPDFAPVIVDVRRDFKGQFYIQFEPADWDKVDEILRIPNEDGLTIQLDALGDWKRLPQMESPLKNKVAMVIKDVPVQISGAEFETELSGIYRPLMKEWIFQSVLDKQCDSSARLLHLEALTGLLQMHSGFGSQPRSQNHWRRRDLCGTPSTGMLAPAIPEHP
ncbi:hypothetical protein BSKO_06119 [Bryopsis sp. KO-2023]|nr:hypothetical protein BSKO_06119 [Bryopsis sp. KO-2023]